MGWNERSTRDYGIEYCLMYKKHGEKKIKVEMVLDEISLEYTML